MPAIFLFGLSISFCFGQSSQSEEKPAAGPLPSKNETLDGAKPELLDCRHLPNLVRVHEKVLSGGLPEGEEAFRELVELGVRTIISVDGARPDVEIARRFGLRYVHLPHGYNGISAGRSKELAKAVRDLDGPIYIHCHHGKHRSPAAASVACIAAGMLPPSRGPAVLEVAGTSPGYLGLFQSVANAMPLASRELDDFQIQFEETVAVPPMAEAMVLLEQTHEQLGKVERSGWRTPEDHPDLFPAHIALILQEHFTEMLRLDEVRGQPAEFRSMLQKSEGAARELHFGLTIWDRAASSRPPDRFKQLSAEIAGACKSCHESYRDKPLSGEKTYFPEK